MSKSHKKPKRYLEPDETEGTERRHKSSKSSSIAPPTAAESPTQADARPLEAPIVEYEANDNVSKGEQKRRKHENHAADEDQATDGNNLAAKSAGPKKKRKAKEKGHGKSDNLTAPTSDAQRSQQQDSIVNNDDALKKGKNPRGRKRKHDDVGIGSASSQDGTVQPLVPSGREVSTTISKERQVLDQDSMDIDSSPAGSSSSGGFGQKPADKAYPFFTQTVSQYLPLFPSGLIKPIDGFVDHHLRPLLNRYVPSFRGVLLAYRDPRVGEVPGEGSLAQGSAIEDAVLLESINEYAVSFGWLTVDVDLFRPARGAWMEGNVNLQGEGHIGVICWDMFNASIEAERLPHGWRWIDLLSKDEDKEKGKGKGGRTDREKTAEEAKLPTPEHLEIPNTDTTQIHTTGYWVDKTGARIRGGVKLYFRIKHYEVGVSGDYGYLSIEGTMLNEEEEKAKYAEEMEVVRKRKLRNGGILRKEQKRLHEFSMTKFGVNEAEDNEAQRAPIWVASHPGSDTE
ncbi:hypothetical protein AAE478_006373 [Parahypoxylon ruwenzoriense]